MSVVLAMEKQPSVEGELFMPSVILKICHPRGGPFLLVMIFVQFLSSLLLDFCHVEVTSRSNLI